MTSSFLGSVTCCKCKSYREVLGAETKAGQALFTQWRSFECRHVGLACGSLQPAGKARVVKRHESSAIIACGNVVAKHYFGAVTALPADDLMELGGPLRSVLPRSGNPEKKNRVFAKKSQEALDQYLNNQLPRAKDTPAAGPASTWSAVQLGKMPASSTFLSASADRRPVPPTGKEAGASTSSRCSSSIIMNKNTADKTSSSSQAKLAPAAGKAASTKKAVSSSAVLSSLYDSLDSASDSASQSQMFLPRRGAASGPLRVSDILDSASESGSQSQAIRVRRAPPAAAVAIESQSLLQDVMVSPSAGQGDRGVSTTSAAPKSRKRARVGREDMGGESDADSSWGDDSDDDDSDDSHGSDEDDDPAHRWIVQRVSGLRIRTRRHQEKELQVLQGLVDRRRERISGGQVWVALRGAGALGQEMAGRPYRDGVARKYISRLLASYEVFNLASGVRRFITALPRRRPKHIGHVHNRLRRFENVLRTWSSWWGLKRKITEKMQLPRGADLSGRVDMVNVDEVPCLRKYGEVGGYSLNFSAIHDDNFTAARESGTLHGSILMWVHSNPALRIEPVVVLSRDWVVGPSKKKRRRHKNCLDAIKPFGLGQASGENKRNGYIDRETFWEEMKKLGEKKVASVGKERPVVVIFDSATHHACTPLEEEHYQDAYGMFFLRILGGVTALVQPVDVCNVASSVRLCGQALAEKDKHESTFESREFWVELREREEAGWHQLKWFEKCGISLSTDIVEEVGTELFRFLARTRELHPQRVAQLDRLYFRHALVGNAPTS
ncbi:unnamed protein product [Amoebophrya sp. A25]|nr:unnamed protein product [Amoebophrya sp. A25]|eukprot:GSA25T00016060001.1